MTVREWIDSDPPKKKHRENIAQLAINQARQAGAAFGGWASLNACLAWLDSEHVRGWYGDSLERWREYLVRMYEAYKLNGMDMKRSRQYMGL